jgi:hypothetical protein
MKMNDTLIQDSIKVASKAISKVTETSDSTNWWMWLAIAEFGIIAFLLIKEQLKSKVTAKQQFKSESLKQDIDFNNIINSSFNSIKLYDELKVKCHPDRFPTDKEKNIIAENLFQEISKNKTNVKRLLELKEEAIQKLNINF